MRAKQFLALLEVDKIHNYIFATNKLKEIRGASYLLSKINEKETIRILQYYKYEPILSIGGMTKVIFDDEDVAKAFLSEVEKLYKDVGISVTTHIEPINGNFSSALGRGENAIRRKKESKQYSYQLNTSPYYKRCSLCSIYPAIKKDKKYDWLCTSCSAKRGQSKEELDIHKMIKKKFKENGRDIRFPSEFSKIGESSKRDGYMGFIIADANRMGEKIREIQNQDKLRQFSEKVEKINKSCLVDAIWHAFENTTLKDKEDNLLPVNILILGGDDMMMVTTAETAAKIALEYCKNFQKYSNSKEDSSTREISISAGVVIAKDTYPINSYATLGEELLKIAKKKSREYRKEDKEVGTIDYKVVTAASSESIKISRYKKERYYKKDNNEFLLTFKPYSLEDMKKLIDFCTDFKKNNFPRNKIKSLEKILRLGKDASILEFLTMKSRLSNNQKALMNKFLREFNIIDQIQMPWRKENDEYKTNLLDLVEIYDFC